MAYGENRFRRLMDVSLNKNRAYKITTGINYTDTFWETQAVKTQIQ